MRALWCILILHGPALSQQKALPDPDEAAYPAIERFVSVLEQVRQRHPDADRLAYERLVNHALEGMLGSLDPHSSFIHPEMAAMIQENPDIDPFVPSLGVTLGWRDDGPYLASILPNSAAGKLQPGSSILQVAEVMTKGMSLAQVVGTLQGAAGEPVKLVIKSPNEPKPSTVTLIHRAVAERAVTDYRLIDESDVGYVRLASYTDASPRELEAALDELEDGGMKRLVLDLRGNPGGSLPATVKILGYFVPPETEVVTIRDRGEDPPEALKTPERQRRKREYPIAVLIDNMSASASELTAGALQDLERATIIGEVSYGKGSVQNIIPMGGGTALRLTIATYHTPSGRTPHLTGITPDIAVEMSEETKKLTALSFRRDSLNPEESAELRNWTDPVLAEALKSLAD